MPPKLLYVEDETIIRVLVMRLLSAYDVTVCHTGELAIQELKHTHFDAIMIDINLGPGINGIELCRSIRDMPRYATTPLAAVTAQWINTKEDLFKEGFTHYLPKPFDREQLIAFVEGMLMKR